MDVWEYRTVAINLREINPKNWSWVAEFSDGSSLAGIDHFLNSEGTSGWELINLVPEFGENQGNGHHQFLVERYRAIFKRKKYTHLYPGEKALTE